MRTSDLIRGLMPTSAIVPSLRNPGLHAWSRSDRRS
jgi:hypothetical protein